MILALMVHVALMERKTTERKAGAAEDKVWGHSGLLKGSVVVHVHLLVSHSCTCPSCNLDTLNDTVSIWFARFREGGS